MKEENSSMCLCVAVVNSARLVILGRGVDMNFDNFRGALDEKQRHTRDGVEYWTARHIQHLLGYGASWQNFEQAIGRAKEACASIGVNARYHFNETVNVIEGGKGAQLQRKDYHLTRYACYLIAMNGDTSKPEIGMAQAYFAMQTRKQERFEEMSEEERRVEKRLQVKDHNKHLASVAKQSGVQKSRFGIFQDSGYRGLYNLPSKAIKAKKGIPPGDNLLDYAGFEELAANDFRITQTARQLIELSVNSEQRANDVHFAVGRKVRNTIIELGNPTPEKLPIEPNIKTLERKMKAKKELPPPGGVTPAE
jgi:DNA-damage-inducible protein D